MKKVALFCAIALLLGMVSLSLAAETQTTNILISKIIKNFAMKTNWGNVYFGQGDLYKVIDSAAKLRPINLGMFQTDLGKMVNVKALGYDKGVVTFLITTK
jgi:hypothetical protein